MFGLRYRYELDDLRKTLKNKDVIHVAAAESLKLQQYRSVNQCLSTNATVSGISQRMRPIIVLGSSLTVYPAASFPEYAKRQGATLL